MTSRTRALSSAMLILVAAACGGGNKPARSEGTAAQAGPAAAPPGAAELSYRALKAELALSKTDKPYLVINVPRSALEVHLHGLTVWDCPMSIASSESDPLDRFAAKFASNGQVLRQVTDKYVYAAKDRNSSQTLDIVAKVVKVDPSLMQRSLPERFLLKFGDGLVLDVRTDVVGTPASKMSNRRMDVREKLGRLTGGATVVFQTDGDHALTLNRVAQPGTPTLIYPAGYVPVAPDATPPARNAAPRPARKPR